MLRNMSFFNKTNLMLCSAGLALLFLSGRVNFLLFHTVAELFSIVVACGIFIIAWHSRHLHGNGFFTFMGIASFAVAVVDLLHTLAYKGMGILPGGGAPMATQLWIGGRYLQGIFTLLAFFFLRRQVKDLPLVMGFAAATVLLLASIHVWPVFPDCYIEGIGLTSFKIWSEYAIILMFAVSLILLRREWKSFDPQVARLIAAALCFFIAGEFAFTQYVNVFGLANQIGHLFKIAGFYCLYRGVIVTGLTRPYDLLFRELKELNRTLAERVSEEVAKNREKDAVLIQQSRQAAMGDMIGNIAHQWRQPLNAIALIVQDLAESCDHADFNREYLDKCVDRVVELTLHMSHTMEEFQNFFRPDREKVLFSLQELIGKSLVLVEGSFRRHGISADIKAREDNVVVGYPNQFAQVVLNILNNARDALVEREIADPAVRIELGRSGQGGS